LNSICEGGLYDHARISASNPNDFRSRALALYRVPDRGFDGQKSPYKPVALVVEDDVWRRELMVVLLEESEMSVIHCDSAEGALRMLDTKNGCVTIMFTDINLAGKIDGVELAHFATRRYPNIRVVVTSALAPTRSLPEGAMFMPKPWLSIDVLREAECSQH
jgi:CheY-like chemotaxis protein